MRTAPIALLGDVHANLPALEAVLAHATQQGAAAFWNIGDFAGYGAYPDQVVQRLRSLGALSIVGNYDLKVLRFPKKREKWRVKKQPEKYLAFKWAYQNLSRDSRRYLGCLPKEILLRLRGTKFLLTHGSPASNEEHLTPETPQERLRELAQATQAQAVICGHSHRPFDRTAAGVRFINTGSVGRADDGDPRACYALMDLKKRSIEVTHYRLEYDIDQAVAAIRDNDLPEAFAQMMIRGYDLDTTLEIISQEG
jgi:putative phosphoesterase